MEKRVALAALVAVSAVSALGDDCESQREGQREN